MTLDEARDGYEHLLGICKTAGIEPVEARFEVEEADEREPYNILIRLAREDRGVPGSGPDLDPDAMTNLHLLLGTLEQVGRERGFHVRPCMF